MYCCALTPDRKRCANPARDASNFCALHQNESARASDPTRVPHRFGGIFSRVRAALHPPIYDGGKYDVPRALMDAPTSYVIEQLQTHDDSMVRWMSAFVLRKRRAVQALEPLWHVLKNDHTRFVRQQSAVALGKIGTPLVCAPLVEALNHDRDQGVRQACAIALGNLALPDDLRLRTAEEIARVLEREENIFVKWDCIVALGQLGDRRVEKLLAHFQAEEITQVIRDAAQDSLAEIRQRDRAAAL